MKLYSKLGLLALLTSSALFSMEMPPRKATSNENDIIHIRAHDTTLAKIERRHIKSSPMLKSLIDETSMDNGIELPESMIRDFKAIQDYLIYEYGLKEKSTNEKVILEMLSQKSELELTSIANACQRFELNLLSPLPIKTLVQKLFAHERMEKCLEKGSFELPLTPDTSKLVAQEMLKNNTSVKMYWLIIEEIIKNKYARMIKARFPSRKTESGSYGSDHINKLFVYGNQQWAYVDEAQEKKINADARNVLGCPLIEEHNSYYPHIFSEYDGKLFVIQLSNKRSDNYFDAQLTPEQFVLLQQRKFDRMISSVSDRKIVNYAGIEKIKRTMPANIQTLIDYKSWQDKFIPDAFTGTMLATAAALAAYFFWR